MDKKQLLKSFQEIKNEIEKFRNKHTVEGLKSKFQAEKKVLEKKIEKTVVQEVNKAKKFLNEQKKELNKIQAKVESAIRQKTKLAKKKTTKKTAKKATTKTTKKKVSKA